MALYAHELKGLSPAEIKKRIVEEQNKSAPAERREYREAGRAIREIARRAGVDLNDPKNKRS